MTHVLTQNRSKNRGSGSCPHDFDRQVAEIQWFMVSKTLRSPNVLSGELTVCNGKSPFLIGKPSINGPFSIAMLVHQRLTMYNCGWLRNPAPADR